MPLKSLTKRISIDIAQRAHKCHANKKHIINRGDKRLKIIEGRSELHYCVGCAQKFLFADIEKLNTITKQL